MLPILIHGENTVDSRNHLHDLSQRAKEKGWEIIHWNKKNEKLDIETLTRSDGLFENNRLVIIEDFSKISNWQALVVKTSPFLQNRKNIFAVFWEGKSLTPTQTKKLAQYYKIEEYKPTQYLFNLLDSLKPGNTKNTLDYLNKVLGVTPAELVVTMLARQLKLLIWAKLDPQTLNLPPWQKNKLISQAKSFSPESLKTLHTKLLELDQKTKTGKLTTNFQNELNLIIIKATQKH